MKLPVSLACLAAVVLACTPAAFAAPTFYTDMAAFDAVTDTTLVEDFEGVTPKDTSLASFTSNGITYAGQPGSNVWVASAGYTNFGVPVTTSAVLTSTGPENFTAEILLDQCVTAVGFDTYLNSFGPATIEVYSGDDMIGSYSLSHDPTQVGFFGVTANDGITKIHWTSIGGERINTGIDNVRVGCVVPAPGALLLGSLGMGLTGWLRRRNTL